MTVVYHADVAVDGQTMDASDVTLPDGQLDLAIVNEVTARTNADATLTTNVGTNTTTLSAINAELLAARSGQANLDARMDLQDVYAIQSRNAALAVDALQLTGVPNPALWLRADRGVYTTETGFSVPANGGSVGRWEDQSGNGRHFTAVPAAVPTYDTSEVNGQPTIKGNGTTAILTHATAATWKFLHDGNPWTIFIVFRPNGADPNAAFGVLGNNGGASAQVGLSLLYEDRLSLVRNDRVRVTLSKGSLGNAIFDQESPDNGMVANGFNVMTVRHDPATALVYVYVGGVVTIAFPTANLPYAATDPSYAMQLFSTGNGVFPGNLDIAELIVATTALTNAQIQAVHDKIMGRYAFSLLAVPYYGSTFTRIDQDAAFYDAFGVLLQADNDELIYVARRGTVHVGDNGGMYKWRSRNGGLTWARSLIVDDATYDDRNAAGGKSSIGTLLVFYGQYNAGTSTWFGMRCLRSVDDGATWSNTALATANTTFSPYGPLVVLPSGALLQTFYGITGTTYRIYTLKSTDDGVTWGTDTTIFTATAGAKYTEVSAILVSGTTDAAAVLVAVSRNDGGKLAQFVSTNGGTSWALQAELPFSVFTTTARLDVSPWLIRDGAYVHMVWADRTTMKLRHVLASTALVAAGVSAWRTPFNLFASTATADNDFGYPSLVVRDGRLRLMFYDALLAVKPDLMHSFIDA